MLTHEAEFECEHLKMYFLVMEDQIKWWIYFPRKAKCQSKTILVVSVLKLIKTWQECERH